MIVYLRGRKSTAYFGPSSIPQAVLSPHPLDARHLSSLEFISSYLVIASLGICSLFMWFLQQGLAFAPYPILTTTNHSYRGFLVYPKTLATGKCIGLKEKRSGTSAELQRGWRSPRSIEATAVSMWAQGCRELTKRPTGTEGERKETEPGCCHLDIKSSYNKIDLLGLGPNNNFLCLLKSVWVMYVTWNQTAPHRQRLKELLKGCTAERLGRGRHVALWWMLGQGLHLALGEHERHRQCGKTAYGLKDLRDDLN